MAYRLNHASLARRPPDIARRICKSIFFTLSRDTSPTRFKLYRNALSLLDSSSQERVRLFYHRADSCRMCPPTLPSACPWSTGALSLSRCFCMVTETVSSVYIPGCLIGRLLPRALLSEKGVSAENIQFAKTDAGKPYFARRLLFFPSVLTPAPASTVMLLPSRSRRASVRPSGIIYPTTMNWWRWPLRQGSTAHLPSRLAST